VAVPINTIDGEPGKRGPLFLLTLSTQILSRRDQ
jgi:hypothetical protein